MARCNHITFSASVIVNRLTDAGAFVADIKICCSDCGLPFIFPGITPGLSSQGLSVSIDSQELHTPIQPKGSVVFPVFPSFGVRVQ